MPSHLGDHPRSPPEPTDDKRAEGEDDIDRLLESALSDMRLCQDPVHDTQDLSHDNYELTKLVEEFKRTASVAAMPPSSDMPEKIDAAVEKLLNMVRGSNKGSALFSRPMQGPPGTTPNPTLRRLTR